MDSAPTRPNILLILTDQQRFDSLSCYGNSVCRTPHLDTLANEGTRFTRAYTCTIPSSPSIASLFTGLYPHKHGVGRNGLEVEKPASSLPARLSDAGYHLGYAGKWHVDEPSLPSDYGFDSDDLPGYGYPAASGEIEGLRFSREWQKPTDNYSRFRSERGYEHPRLLSAYYGSNPGRQNQELYGLLSGTEKPCFESMVCDRTLGLINQFANSDSSEPFFVWSNFFGPHTPCVLPEPYYSMYDPRTICVEESFQDDLQNKPYLQSLYRRFWGLEGEDWSRRQEIIARYYGYVTFIDDLVGRILKTLKQTGLLENTLVVFAGDHGEMLGAHGLIEKGPFAYEETYRIPLICRLPGAGRPPATCDSFVYLHDLYATLCDVAGVPVNGDTDARSLLPGLSGTGAFPNRSEVFCSFTSHLFPAPHRMVCTGDYKLVFNRCDRGEVYDLRFDSAERVNRFGDSTYAAVKEELMGLMRGYLVGLNDPLLSRFDQIAPVY